MAVFSADIQTPLAVKDPGTDHMLPPPGALTYANITTLTALAGTTGVHASLVAGDSNHVMTGNEATRISENRSHNVGGNQQKAIAGNKNENVTGNFNHTTLGNMGRSIIGATNDLFTGAHAIDHKANQLLNEPKQYFQNVAERYHMEKEHHDIYGLYQLVAGNVINLIHTNVDLKAFQLAAIAASAETTAASYADHLAHIADKKIDARFAAVHSRIGAIQPVVHVAYFHEVAITQKIIVIGVNQFM